MALKPIIASHSDLLLDRDASKFNADVTSASAIITVYSIAKFAVNKVLLLGPMGSEGSEVIKTHATTAPTGNTVTLASNTTKSHSKDAPVTILPYDQVEFSHAESDGGAITVLDTQTIDAEKGENLYEDNTNTSGVYYVRYYNSILDVYSDYSDPIPYGGLDYDTAGYAIEIALASTDKKRSSILTDELLYAEINACLRFIRGKLKKWSNFLEPNYVVGQTARGVYTFDMPDDIYENNTNKSILSVKVGNDQPLKWVDKKEIDSILEDTIYTKVATQTAVGDTSLVLDNTYDIGDSGSITIYTNNTANVITFTTNTRTTGTLSGIPATGDGSIDAVHVLGTNVWQNHSESKPTYFTVLDGKLYVLPLVSSQHQNENVTMDYYTDIDEVNSPADKLVGPRMDMVKHWLKWKIRAITENDGKEELNDPDFFMFQTILKQAIKMEVSGQKYKWSPKLNQIKYHGRRGTFDTN